ncbi:elongation factor P maturation arginine rhamnosyltransferase EarP [Hydrogenophaga sp.]|uniref:elongation factor P maturation arginine rhamnosyltransferase EarP n=1 Tax=Hydrogenophaga sp. TaxID=1904254 RepID=UPI0025C6DECB|nr:elongation factor P maturation arginine rhamnosyltransferase EarP [Hydrogenophaga sp.]
MAKPSHPVWDLFCRVIDNFGDVGVCWRLAAQLGARGHSVRLWIDDPTALAWMAPQGAPGVQVLRWSEPFDPHGLTPGDVWIEGFGCELPEPFVAARTRDPVWLNLEYLSAEAFVRRQHGLPSPVMHGPGRGLTKWFFHPGFTDGTGGLLREDDLAARQAAFERDRWRAGHGLKPDERLSVLFCYEPAALPAVMAEAPTHWLVTPGRAAAASHHLPLATGASRQTLPYLDQPGFDELLWAADLNFVRGEDSLVRALWAGQPFIWHIYPQHDDAHHAKLDAFLDWLDAPVSLRTLHRQWNGIEPGAAWPGWTTVDSWRPVVQAARARLLAQADLATQLAGFVATKG